MNKLTKLLLGLLVLFNACSPSVQKNLSKSYPALPVAEDVKVYDLYETEPYGEFLGTIWVGDSGFTTNCSYDVVLGMAKNEARLIGGNAIKITEHRKPDFISSCHRIKVNVLKIDTLSKPIQKQNKKVETNTITQSDYYAPQVNSTNFAKVRLGVNGGYSYLTAPVSDDVASSMKNYVKKLKSGYCLGADFHYFFNDKFGFGVKYNLHKSSNEMNSGYYKDDISIQTTGLSLLRKYSLHDKAYSLLVGISLNYLFYRDEGADTYIPVTMEGQTLGFGGSVGLDRKLSDELKLNLSFSYSIGSLSEWTVKSGGTTTKVTPDKASDYQNLSKLELTIGLVFMK